MLQLGSVAIPAPSVYDQRLFHAITARTDVEVAEGKSRVDMNQVVGDSHSARPSIISVGSQQLGDGHDEGSVEAGKDADDAFLDECGDDEFDDLAGNGGPDLGSTQISTSSSSRRGLLPQSSASPFGAAMAADRTSRLSEGAAATHVRRRRLMEHQPNAFDRMVAASGAPAAEGGEDGDSVMSSTDGMSVASSHSDLRASAFRGPANQRRRRHGKESNKSKSRRRREKKKRARKIRMRKEMMLEQWRDQAGLTDIPSSSSLAELSNERIEHLFIRFGTKIRSSDPVQTAKFWIIVLAFIVQSATNMTGAGNARNMVRNIKAVLDKPENKMLLYRVSRHFLFRATMGPVAQLALLMGINMSATVMSNGGKGWLVNIMNMALGSIGGGGDASGGNPAARNSVSYSMDVSGDKGEGGVSSGDGAVLADLVGGMLGGGGGGGLGSLLGTILGGGSGGGNTRPSVAAVRNRRRRRRRTGGNNTQQTGAEGDEPNKQTEGQSQVLVEEEEVEDDDDNDDRGDAATEMDDDDDSDDDLVL